MTTSDYAVRIWKTTGGWYWALYLLGRVQGSLKLCSTFEEAKIQADTALSKC